MSRASPGSALVPITRFFEAITEPVLRPVRRIVPPLAWAAPPWTSRRSSSGFVDTDPQRPARRSEGGSIHHLLEGGRYHPSMDLSAKLLREVEFRTSLRGYDTDEVDEFLEKVAVAVDELQEKMRQLAYRAERAERAVSDRAAEEDDDSIRRTLVLAQRTADMAVREAQEQAAVLMDTARSESEKLLTDARERTPNASPPKPSGAMPTTCPGCTARGHQVNAELKELSELLDNERKRLTESLRVALGLVEKTLTPSKEISKRRSAPTASPAHDEDDIEAQINEDAATAAPTVRSSTRARGVDEGGRANLAAVPPLEDSGPPTQAWRAGVHDHLRPRQRLRFGAGTRIGPALLRQPRIGLDRLSSDARPGGLGVRGAKAAPPGAPAQPRRWTCDDAVAVGQLASALNTSSAFEVCASGVGRQRSRSRSRAPGPRCGPSTAGRRPLEASGSPIHSRIRSVTFSPASRRARCTKRMTSRARPSASSSGVVSRSSATIPTSPGRLRLEAGSEGRRRSSNSPGSSSTPPASTVPSGSRDHSPLRVCGDDVLGALSEPRAEHGGDDVENGLGQVADGLDQLDLLHVHLVGDQVGVVQQLAGTRCRHRQGRQWQACPAPGRLADRVAGRAHLPGEVHGLDEPGVRGQFAGVRPSFEVHAALAG